jgi:hypothetical protein
MALATNIDRIDSARHFKDRVLEIVHEIVRHGHELSDIGTDEFPYDRAYLFNSERHFLLGHQLDAVRNSVTGIVLSEEKHSGYCFMPTSAGKSYIIIALAALAVGDFELFRSVSAIYPGILLERPEIFPFLVNLSFQYSRLVPKTSITRTQVLVHDIEILDQIRRDTSSRLPLDLAERISFSSVQAHRNQERRRNIKYLIVDENHWGNASPDETVQSELVAEIKASGGKAFGFTASPYEHPDGKYQRTWSSNKINEERDFNYYLDHKIIHNGIVFHEKNLQGARIDYTLGDEEIELTEKKQVIEFITQQMQLVLPPTLDFPGICFFSAVIIPDIVREFINSPTNGSYWRSVIKILGSNDAQFIEKCRTQFGADIIADDRTIESVTKGEKILLISQQKLLVGFNAPHLKYCFISPTNSKIKILQGLGRLMRPSDKVDRKYGVLFLTSLSGKKMDIGDDRSDDGSTEREPCADCGFKLCDCPCDECGQPRISLCECPKARYATTSLTLSEAYDLSVKVFYREAVQFRDFINETLVNNQNAVFRIGSVKIPKDDLDALDDVRELAELRRIRELCRVAYYDEVFRRDRNACQGKRILGEGGCDRTAHEVRLEVHHMPPFEFAELMRAKGPDGTIAWHSNPENWKHLVALCKDCHDEFHRRESRGELQEAS